MKRSITFGSHKKEYILLRKQRKTMSLSVKPDLTIVLSCPTQATEERIEIFLKKKWKWMDEQIAFFKKYQRKIYKKEYVSGESFYYLGRQYQLVVKKCKNERVILSNGKLVVETDQKANRLHIKLLIDMWYKEMAKSIFRERFDDLYATFGYKKRVLLRIAPMKRKWGSFKGVTVTLNPLLIQASKDAIDYVITHELCHVRYKNHDKQFWALMDKIYPGWEKVKEKLELQIG